MTLEEAQTAANHKLPCEFYSTGTGKVALLDKGWHRVEIQEVDWKQEHITAYTYPYTIKVRDREDIAKYLRFASSTNP